MAKKMKQKQRSAHLEGEPMIGVLGGMGPAATVDFLDKLVMFTDANNDQDHVPVVVLNDPRIPDRTQAIISGGLSPLPILNKFVEYLEKLDVEFVVIPCNSAHYWYDELVKNSSVPVLSIVNATIDEVCSVADPGDTIGVLATSGTRFAKLYDKELTAAGFLIGHLNENEQEIFVSAGIALIKAGKTKEARGLIHRAIERLAEVGCRHIILGCTEISVILGREAHINNMTVIDSNSALAKMTLRRIGRKLRI
jgi:aspartate racemase